MGDPDEEDHESDGEKDHRLALMREKVMSLMIEVREREDRIALLEDWNHELANRNGELEERLLSLEGRQGHRVDDDLDEGHRARSDVVEVVAGGGRGGDRVTMLLLEQKASQAGKERDDALEALNAVLKENTQIVKRSQRAREGLSEVEERASASARQVEEEHRREVEVLEERARNVLNEVEERARERLTEMKAMHEKALSAAHSKAKLGGVHPCPDEGKAAEAHALSGAGDKGGVQTAVRAESTGHSFAEGDDDGAVVKRAAGDAARGRDADNAAPLGMACNAEDAYQADEAMTDLWHFAGTSERRLQYHKQHRCFVTEHFAGVMCVMVQYCATLAGLLLS